MDLRTLLRLALGMVAGSDVSNGSSLMNQNAVSALSLAPGSNGVQGSIPNSPSTHPPSPSLPSGSAPSLTVLTDTESTSSLQEALVLSNVTNPALISFHQVSRTEHPSLFSLKVSLCSVLFDFSQPSVAGNEREKEMKRQTLFELVDYVHTGTAKLNVTMVEQCFEMIMVNIFRAVPTMVRRHKVLRRDSGALMVDAEEEGPFREPAWPHLQLVYELLLCYVRSTETDPEVAQRFVNQSLVLLLLELFDSEDQREREWLRSILCHVYCRFPMHRPFICKSINDIFYRFILETEKHNGIAELLDILGSIIMGFAIPLNEEHKRLLVGVLIPLHKPKCLAMYHQELTRCITWFVMKDFALADMVICGLLKYWPAMSTEKELLFLDELQEILLITKPAEFRQCMIPLFKRLALCINSSHVRVASSTLCLWQHNYDFVTMVWDNRKVILPLIFPALEENANHHWSSSVKTLTSNVSRMFEDLDNDLFLECRKEYQRGSSPPR